MSTSSNASSILLSPPALKTQDSIPRFVPIDEDKHVCCKCEKEAELEGNMFCDKCSNVYHPYCTDLPIYELVKYFKRSFNRKFTCGACVEKLYRNDMQKIQQQISQCAPNRHVHEDNRELKAKLSKYHETIEHSSSKSRT